MGNADSKQNDAVLLSTESLDLSHKKLTTLPPELRKVVNLLILGISNNELADISTLDNKKLQELDASFNKIDKIPEQLTISTKAPFFLLKELRKLNLANNLLREVPTPIVNFQLLTELNVSGNKIQVLTEQIGNLPSLTTLNISSNELKALPSDIGKLTNLTKLLVNNNSIRELTPNVGRLPSLVLLNAAENNLEKVPAELGSLSSLSKLYLDNNDLLDLNPALGNLVTLKELNIRSNQLIDLPSKFANLTNLIILDLTDNPWDSKNYTQDDIPALLAFLKTKKDVHKKRTGTVSKAFRREETKRQLDQIKATSKTNVTDFVVVESHKKLYHLKGDKRIVVQRVDPIVTSLNNGDVFVLDEGKKIFIWCGLKSNLREKRKGIHLANLMNEEMGGGSDVVLLDNKASKSDQEQFWQALGGRGYISGPDEGDDDAAANLTLQTKLFKFMEDEGGRLDIAIWFGEDLYKDMLDSSSCYVLDCGADVWVWAGVYSSTSEKSWAMLKAEELVGHGKRPESAEIIWVVDGAETLLFRENFVDWTDNSWDVDDKKGKKKGSTLEREESWSNAEMYPSRESWRLSIPSTISPQISPSLPRRPHSGSFTPTNTPPATPITAQRLSSVSATTPSVTRDAVPSTPSPTSAAPVATLTPTPPKAADGPKQSIKDRMKAFDETKPATASTTKLATTDVAAEIERDKERERELERERLKEREREKIKEKQKLRQEDSMSPAEKEELRKQEEEKKKQEEREKAKEREREKAREREKEKLGKTSKLEVKPPASEEKLKKEEKAREEKAKQEERARADEKIKQAELERQAEREKEKQVERDRLAERQKEAERVRLEKEREKEQAKAAAKVEIEEPETTDEKKSDQKRRLPTKNPIRARQEREVKEKEAAKLREEAKKAEEEAARAAGTSVGLSSSEAKARAGRNAQIGGMGLLYALGADEYLFQKKDTLKSTTGEQSNVLPQNLPRLIHVKGRRNCFVRQVELSYKSLNKGDTFVLDCGKGVNTLYQWNGSEANRIEKGKAMDIAKSIKDKERVGARVVIVDEGKETDDFWKAIGGKGPVASAASAGDDKEAEQAIRQYIHLHKVIKKPDGSADINVVAEGRLLKEMLELTECYILDCVSEMYVWTGTNTDIKLRNAALKLANELMEPRNFWTAPVARELPGSEQILFKERFANWGGSLPITVQQVASGTNTASARKQEKIDVMTMHALKREKEEVMIDDGQGKVTIWRVEEYTKVEVPPSKYGEFYSGDSYLILYSYVFKNKDCYLIYFWQGRNSTINEKGASALLTIEQNDILKGAAKDVRVVQNKEPKHFLTVFKGKIVVHLGKDPEAKKSGSGFKSEVGLYHVRGTNEVNTRAIQINTSACGLTSMSAFVLKARNKVFAWYGTYSNNFERNFAKNVFAHEGQQVIEINEGSEPADWWTLLGGKEKYPPHLLPIRREPRLFACSAASGVFAVEEISPFAQDDLQNDDVMIIDAHGAVFVWIGNLSTENERKHAMETAVDYVEKAPDKRPADSPIWLLRIGEEPYVFTCHFHGWDFTKRKAALTYDGNISSVREALAQYNRKYTYQELVDKKYPKGIDTSRLEEYLNDDEFMKVFEMSAEEFSKQPLWKRQNVKRDLGLY
eukprot:Phypoly_transcript_00343.p1 GENE.Phypoly_transcript_00343~~Phypoly_transcript_00343.p1  ORF type:complete len:1625 (+),score=418.05 Phypoly_transcript_00343:184-5058(+)